MSDPFAALDEVLAASPAGANGVLFLPWLSGSMSPTADRSMRGGFVAACDEIMRDKGIGDTLIFLPGEREIRDAHQAL
mgnify:CR=1 FL=1